MQIDPYAIVGKSKVLAQRYDGFFLSFGNNCVYDDDTIQRGLFFITGHLCGEAECQSDILPNVNDAKIEFGFGGRWG